MHSNRLPPSCCFISENSSIKINLCLVKYRLAISKPTTSRPGVNSVKEDPVWKCVVRRLRAETLNRLGRGEAPPCGASKQTGAVVLMARCLPSTREALGSIPRST